MAYQGNVPAESYTNTVKDTFNGNGSTTAFTLSLPTVTNDIRVVVENVVQEPTAAYSVSGTTLTFTAAPPSGTGNVYVVHLGPAVQTVQPPSTISNATVFESSVTVQGAFTSLGIDDNATSTAMTIDSSGNVLMGKTVTDFGTQGVRLSTVGTVLATSNGNAPAELNRLTSDGTLLGLYKDGTTVGSIGSYVSLPYIGKSDVNLLFDPAGPHIVPRGTDGGARDAAINLGSTANRFKDLYLSGGVYLGGTGAANHLDDYEEGTFTLTIGGVAGAFGLGKYVKVGRLVHFQWYSSGSFTAGASSANFTGLPFLTAPSSYYSVFYAYHNTYCGTASGGYLDVNATSGVFTNNGSTAPASANATSGLYLMLAGNYYTDQ